MKKALIWSLAFLALYTPHLFAEWEAVAATANGLLTNHIDRTTIRKNNGFVYYWVLTDYLEPEDGYFSVKNYFKGICSTKMITLQSSQYFSLPMAKGEPAKVNNYEGDEWSNITPKSLGDYTMAAVCD